MKRLIIIFTFGLFTNLCGQTFLNLEKALTKEFPANSKVDGRWVFYVDKANIETIGKPLVKTVVPNYTFYKVTLINYLGYHINEGTCLILYDSLKSKILLVEPLWYGGVNEQLLKLFMKQQFASKDILLSFLKELNELMEIGSGYKFINTSSSDTLIGYDLVYLKGDSYTTGGNGTTSTVQYNEDGVWRQIRIDINKLKIIRFTSINPKTKEEEIIK